MLLKRIELLTNDLPATEQFYAQTLALPVLNRTNTSLHLAVGTSTLVFHENRACQPFYHLAFLIPANLLHEAFIWVSQRTTILPFTPEIPVAHFDNWNAKAFYFYDNQGNILECIARYDLQHHSEAIFTSSSLLNVNEMGIVVGQVSQFCEDIHSNYGIPYFEKGPVLQDFTVMGEAEALLIVTKSGRGWLPTRKPAEQHPIALTIELQESLINLQV